MYLLYNTNKIDIFINNKYVVYRRQGNDDVNWTN